MTGISAAVGTADPLVRIFTNATAAASLACGAGDMA
jgi:hypothetical protein